MGVIVEIGKAIVAWFSSPSNWAMLRTTIIAILETAWVRTILLQIFGASISGGYQVWIAKLIVEYAFKELALPIIQLAFRKMGYEYNRVEGAIIFKRIQDAKGNNDQAAYDKAIDDLFRS